MTQVLCRVGNDTFEARTRDVSSSGVYLETAYLFDPSQEITVVLDVPGQGTVSTTGRPTRVVARKSLSQYHVGVAIQFLETHPETV